MATKFELDVKSTTAKLPVVSRKGFQTICKGVRDDTF